MASTTTVFLLSLPSIPNLPSFSRPFSPPISTFNLKLTTTILPLNPKAPFVVRADDVDADAAELDYDMDEEELEELDNKKDFDPEYEPLAGAGGGDADIVVPGSHSFVSTQGWDSETVMDYRINEEEFHKISLLDCDFFIRKPPDPDNDVYDFREMYVTPPDTDVYSIPKVLAPMPQKVFLTKHFKNRRFEDPEFVLDFEEIYVIDSKTRSITRAKVTVTIPEGRNRDRKNDLLVIRDNGHSFKIIHRNEKEDPTTVIEKEEWAKTREDMERHLRKLRDFSISNWF